MISSVGTCSSCFCCHVNWIKIKGQDGWTSERSDCLLLLYTVYVCEQIKEDKETKKKWLKKSTKTWEPQLYTKHDEPAADWTKCFSSQTP